MKTPGLLPLVLSLLVPLVPMARADEAADKEQIRDLEKQCVAALLKGDPAPLAEIFAEDWVVVDEAGDVHKRDDIFEELKSGELKFYAYDLGEMDVRLAGDTAVVIGHGHPRGKFKGEFFEQNELFTDTFARVGGKWRCLVSHSTEVPDSE
jgi:uncharacterized protein (TIGR02246 family)